MASKWSAAVPAAALLALLAALPAGSQRRSAPKALTEETLVPTEVFPEEQGKRFGYPNGFDVLYFRTETGHVWKITERSVSMDAPPAGTPEPSPSPAEAGAEPTPEPTPTPAVPVDEPLPPSNDEQAFIEKVGLVRPTYVTLVFTDSAETASGMVNDLWARWSDKEALPENLAVMELEKQPSLGKDAVLYKRQYDLGPKSGGVRRGSTLALAKGSTFLRIDAYWGLRDGSFEAELDTLEKRARQVLDFVRPKV